MKPFIERLADCIERQEGPNGNHNPGNIWDGLNPPYKTHRIWLRYPIDARGMLVLPDEATGRAILVHDLRVKIDHHRFTLREAIEMYCPRTDPRNDTSRYIADVAGWMKIDPDVPLEALERDEREMIGRLEKEGEIDNAQ